MYFRERKKIVLWFEKWEEKCKTGFEIVVKILNLSKFSQKIFLVLVLTLPHDPNPYAKGPSHSFPPGGPRLNHICNLHIRQKIPPHAEGNWQKIDPLKARAHEQCIVFTLLEPFQAFNCPSGLKRNSPWINLQYPSIFSFYIRPFTFYRPL